MMQKLSGQGVVVIGGQWGDEGKGRIVDSLAADCDVVVRFHGGNNAGHSLHIGDKSLVLHLVPCGVMREDKMSIIGNGVVIDPEILFEEIALLHRHGVKCDHSNLRISDTAHIIFPFHKSLDAIRENTSEYHIGTTKRGIGPCYEDKTARFGIMAKDLLNKNILSKKLQTLTGLRSIKTSLKELIDFGISFGEKLKPFLTDTGELLDSYFCQQKRVLFEGAQGTLLDVDHGTYPFVTSSNCVAAQASIGTGIGMHRFNEIFLVSKAYCTRVGEGPFFTEANKEDQERFRTFGNEFGATTGRPRRCGWLDLPALKYAARLNGATGIVLTKVDILAKMDTIKLATSYSNQQKDKLTFTEVMNCFSNAIPFEVNYKEFHGEKTMPKEANKMEDLPESIREMCRLIELETALPIRMISYGPKRGQEIFLK